MGQLKNCSVPPLPLPHATRQLRGNAGRTAELEARAAGATRDLEAARHQLARAEGQLASKANALADSQAEVARLTAQVGAAGSAAWQAGGRRRALRT